MKKTIRFLLSFLFVYVNTSDIYGQSLPRCQTHINPKINFFSSLGELEYDFSKNSQEISALTDKSVVGLATTSFGATHHVKYHLNRFGKGYCVSAKEIMVFVGISKPTIYVTNEYLEGSCFHNFVLRHEQAHMQTSIRMLDHFMKNAPNMFTYAIRRIQPIYAKDQAEIDRAGDVLYQEYLAVIESMKTVLQRESDVEQDKMDAENVKYLLREVCWEQMKEYKQFSKENGSY